MNAKKYRLFILLNWLLLAACTLALVWSRVLPPPELKAYLGAQEHSPVTAWDMILFVAALIGLVLWVVATVGLFFFKRWAKALYPLVFAIGLVLILARGVHVETGWVKGFAYLDDVSGGMILALTYFSNVSRYFDERGDV
jgi:hypothetical protein